MDRTVRALSDLSAIDDQLDGQRIPGDGLVPVLKRRRAALRKVIPGVFLAAYDVLGRLRRRPVVVAVRSAHCGGCYLRLPPQLDSSLRRRQSLCICPHCRRLLYSPPGAKEDAATNDPTHGLERRPALEVAASKPARRVRGRRPARAQPHAAVPRKASGSVAGRPGAETPPTTATPVEP